MQKVYKVLLLVENAPIPGDPRVWNEAVTLRDAGYQVCIIAPKGVTPQSQEAYSCIEGIPVYRFKLLGAQSKCLAYLLEYSSALFFVFWLSLKVWRRHGFDIIHAANPPDIFFLIGLFYRCFARKFVFDQHDLSPELFQVHFRDRVGPLYPLLRMLERCSYRFAHVVIAANESFRHLAVERGRCLPEKVFVVRNGPTPVGVERCGLASRRFFDDQSRYVLAYAGIMGKQDGVEYALYALHYLVSICERKDILAVFIGAGSALNRLRALTHQLDLDEHVLFTGWLERREMLSYLAAADVGLLPDPQNGLNEFCTMLKALEYMSVGLPFVAFDLAETRVLAEGAALYAKPNEVTDFARQLERLLAREELRHAMGAVGRNRVVKTFSWEHSRKDLLAAYESLLSVQ